MARLQPFLRRDSLNQKFVLVHDAPALHTHIPSDALPAGYAEWGGTAREFDWEGTVDGWMEEERSVDGFDPAALVG